MGQTRVYTVEDKEFWEGLYAGGKTAWDLGQPAPPLVTFLKSPYALKPGRMAVLGCGNGHECLMFAQAGFEVTGVDFSKSAIQSTTRKLHQAGLLGTKGYLLERDLFKMHEYDHYYDYVLDHCTFCAIDPARRQSYAWTVHDLLKPGGKFVSLWWVRPDRQGGPPFALHKSEIFELFDKKFKIEIAYEPQDSVKERKGQEFLTVMSAR
ncbi:MAG: methyltransferase domain-containing protein [Candidatus Obscuribacterales bacterium]|nr:methyltransferase domain-containing protein [Candidatus Obscuribacterales bacterium]